MKKQLLTKEEFQRMKYEFSEYKEILPLNLANVMEKAFVLLRPYIELEEPLGYELEVVLRKLIHQEFSWMDCPADSFWNRWLDEIADEMAIELASEIAGLVCPNEGAERLCDLYDDFDDLYKFYTEPQTVELSTLPDWSDDEFWAEMTEEEQKAFVDTTLKEYDEEYKAEKWACDLHNRMKNDFIETVQPVIFKYISDKIENFDAYMWQEYAISLGFVFLRYEDRCTDLEYMYDKEELTEDPGLCFNEYNIQFKEKFFYAGSRSSAPQPDESNAPA